MLSLILMLITACNFDSESLLGPRIVETAETRIQVEVPEGRTFGSATTIVPAFSAVPIHFQTHGTTNHLEVVLNVSGFVHFTAEPGFGQHTVMQTVGRDTYVSFDRMTTEGDFILMATNDTGIERSTVYIGYSEEPGYITTSRKQSHAADDEPRPDLAMAPDQWRCTTTIKSGKRTDNKCGYGPNFSQTKP